MKTSLLIIFLFISGYLLGQSSNYPLVTLHDINFTSDTTNWPNSPLDGDTVRVQGLVLCRPLVDAATDRRAIMYFAAALGTYIESPDGSPWGGLMIYQGDSTAYATGFDHCDTASIYEFTGVITPYGNPTELMLITAPTPIPVRLVSQEAKRPDPRILTLDSCFNSDGSFSVKLNKYLGMYIEIVPDISHRGIITSNLITGSRSDAGSFNIDNGNGHIIQVSAQSKYFKTLSGLTLRPTYIPPPNGTHLGYVKGILEGYSNTCRIDPLYPNDLGLTLQFPQSISSPIGGENWQVGTLHNITWNSVDDGNIKVEITTDNGANWFSLQSSVAANLGNYTLTVPPFPNSNQCKIKLTSLTYGNIVSSSAFTISSSIVPNVTITSPNSQITWNTGTMHNLTWTLTGSVDNVKLEYTTDNGNSWNPITNSTAAATQSFKWMVPYASSTSCRIKITDVTNMSLNDVSDTLFIITNNPISSTHKPATGQVTQNFDLTNINFTAFILVTDSITTTFFSYVSPQPGTLPSGVVGVSKYYWLLTSTSISFFNGIISVPLDFLTGVNNPTNLVWLKRTNPGDAWTNLGGTITNGNLVSTVPFTSLSEFAIGTTGNDPLPVQLVNFSGKQTNGNVLLTWETKTEVQNSGFDVERKAAKDKQFVKIGFIKGSGNSNVPKQYVYSDNSSQGGKVAYRLGQINSNGLVTYSNEIEVTIIPSEYILYQNYPNPFNPSTVIRYAVPFESNVKISFYNSLGQCVREVNEAGRQPGYYELTFNSSGLASGVYFYSIKAGSSDGKNNFSTIRKMIIMK